MNIVLVCYAKKKKWEFHAYHNEVVTKVGKLLKVPE